MTNGLYPEREPRRIDYDLMQREHPKLKAALTRAENSKNPLLVADAVDKALDVWAKVGCWPDDWSRWQRALEDAWMAFQRSDAFDDDRFDNNSVIANRMRAVAARIDT